MKAKVLLLKRHLTVPFEQWKEMITRPDTKNGRVKYGSLGGQAWQDAGDPQLVYGLLYWQSDMPYDKYFSLPETKAVLDKTGTLGIFEAGDAETGTANINEVLKSLGMEAVKLGQSFKLEE